MSRTDKDTPWWVIADEWSPVHYRCDQAIHSRWITRDDYYNRICDLPPEPRIKDYHSDRRPRRTTKGCRWAPEWPKQRRSFGSWSVPKWFVNHVWNGPQRREARDDALLATKQYRATGDVDVVIPTEQHRHGAVWLYW